MFNKEQRYLGANTTRLQTDKHTTGELIKRTEVEGESDVLVDE
jgi:hypothetical protein